MKKLVSVVVPCCIMLMFSCNRTKNNAKPLMYERSELATLMVDMFDENNAIKKALISGDGDVKFSGIHSKLQTSEPTDSADLTPIYYEMAGHYQKLVDSFSGGTIDTRINRYNTVVDGCVSCHENFCTGPIPKIKSLYIRD